MDGMVVATPKELMEKPPTLLNHDFLRYVTPKSEISYQSESGGKMKTDVPKTAHIF
jgi:hypothetical protein